MDQKVLLVAFNGEPMCFVHVLLNALDMDGKGYDVKVIIEGSATKMAAEMNSPEAPFGKLYLNVRERGLIDCVCRACAAKMGVTESVKEQNLPLKDEMQGHPSMTAWIEAGYKVITF